MQPQDIEGYPVLWANLGCHFMCYTLLALTR